ncbi:hypothetical protein EYF80_029998 [Liparis tanakae]|uniref:Uncharacterized protein n=1 Tax=Liparis tanakae TaxID=230148 RepID=A0A4Z2H3Z5_9TELE|nr:hypothetical protein EYF80_029998 [Liparis tanakae]
MRVGPTLARGKQGWDKLIGRAVAGFPSHRPGKHEEKAAKPPAETEEKEENGLGGYTPLSSLPCFIRRTLIFSLMSESRRSGQKQSSAGAITTSRGIPQDTLWVTHWDGVSLAPQNNVRSNEHKCSPERVY